MKAADIQVGGEYLYNSGQHKYAHEDRRVRVLEAPIAGGRYGRGPLNAARVLVLDMETGEPQMVTRFYGSPELVENIQTVPLRHILRSWEDHQPIIQARMEERDVLEAEQARITAIATEMNVLLGLSENDRAGDRWAPRGIFSGHRRTNQVVTFDLDITEEQAHALIARLKENA